jgi:hypothetical protein
MPTNHGAALGWMATVFLCCALGSAQKLDSWVLDNSHIGPHSPIEIPMGGSYQASVGYPNPDGPVSPLKAKIVWTIFPAVKGITVDPNSGMITVANDVPSGTTAMVRANVANGLRKLSAKVVVFNPAEMPLLGQWKIQQVVLCDESKKVDLPHNTPRANDYWSFRTDKSTSVGIPMGIAATTRWWGTYEHDLAAGKVKFTRKWVNGADTEEWNVVMVSDQEAKLIILQPPGPPNNVCGYALVRAVPMKNPLVH